MKVTIDADPQLDYRFSVQSTDHGIQFQPGLVFIIRLMAEKCRHVGVGVDIEDNGIPYLINDTGLALVLYRYVKVVSRGGRHGDIVFPIRGGQKSIKCQVKEVLRNASVREGDLRLHGRQPSNFTLGDRHPGGENWVRRLDEKAVGRQDIVIVDALLPGDPVRVIHQVSHHFHALHFHVHQVFQVADTDQVVDREFLLVVEILPEPDDVIRVELRPVFQVGA